MKILVCSKDNGIAKEIKQIVNDTLGSQVKETIIEKSFEKAASSLSKIKPSLFIFTYDTLFTEEGFRLPKLNVPSIVLGESFRKSDDVIKAGALAFFTLPLNKEVLSLAIGKWLKKPSQVSNLKFKVKGEEITVPVNKIQYVQAEDKICHLFLKEPAKKLSIPYSLKTVFEQLPSDFLKVHKTFIVKESAIDEIYYTPGSRYMLKLKNGKEIPVGRKYYQLVKIALNKK